ncbi:MAG: hypothetical protein GF364_05715, partial [Candidatus Lokiarchaeota archaeon]|nr:hypothetical protein [Candidatus Lokiarchaeota archaeon]
SICALDSLEKLYLGGNPIKELPDCIGNLASLKELMLWGTDIIALPDSICSLKKLERLVLFHSELRTLPDCIGDLKSLETLNAGHCYLTSVPDSITKLTSLTYFSVWMNDIESATKKIFKWTKKLSKNGCRELWHIQRNKNLSMRFGKKGFLWKIWVYLRNLINLIIKKLN